MSDQTTTVTLPPKLLGKLNSLAVGLRLRFTLEGFGWLVVTAVLLLLATFALDWLLRLDRLPRGVVMVGAYTVLAWVIWRRLIRPMLVPLSREDLGMLVERRYPQLQSRLISLVEFARQPLPESMSGAMVAHLAEEATAMADAVDFRTVIERRNLWRVLKMAFCAVAIVAGLVIWQGTLVRIWMERNVLLGDAYWPQRTYLTVTGDDFSVLRGDDLTVYVNVTNGSEAPPVLVVRANYPSVGWTEERIALPSADARQFEVVFRSVTEPFEFYVSGGDDSRDKRQPHHVSLVDPPSVAGMTFTVVPPSYTGREPFEVDGASGAITIPAGGALELDAMATKPLASAELAVRDGEARVTAPLRVIPVSETDPTPLRVIGKLAMGQVNASRSAGLQVILTDARGYASRREGEYILRVVPDQPPTVTTKKFGVGSLITPEAMIPVRIAGEDDHGLAGGVVAVSVLQDSAFGWETPLRWESRQIPRRGMTQEYIVDLQDRSVVAGQTVSIVVSLTDTMPAAMGGPNSNSASAITLHVVSPEELMKDLVLRQKTQRLEFVQAMGQQQSARAKVTKLIDEADSVPAAEREGQLGQVTGLEQSVAAEIAKASQMLQGVYDELSNNRLGAPSDREMLQKHVIDPLDALSDDLANLMAEVEEARRQSDPAEVAERLDAVAASQDKAMGEMESILEYMEKLQSRQDLANQLQLIINWSRESLEWIEAKEAEKVETIWGDGDHNEEEGSSND